jgi:hypothetical protein
MANYQSVDTVVQSSLDDFPVEAILEGDYLVYLKNKTAPQELWAYQLSTNAHTRLTNTNWNWTISEMNNGITNFDIDGTRVVWAASYPDQGAIYADYDIYSYDLSVGPSSYYQVTKNATEDYMPRVAGGRLFWTGQDESPLQMKIYEEKNGAPVHFADGALIGASETTVAWGDFSGSQVHAKVLGKEFNITVPHQASSSVIVSMNTTDKGVDNENFTFTLAAINDDILEIWAAYYIGPGAMLTGIDFTEEKIAGLNLNWADLRMVDLTRVDVTETDFRGADLTGATGLEYAIGPAFFSHETILPTYFNAHDAGWIYQTPESSGCAAMILGLLTLGVTRNRRRNRCC